MNYLYIVFVSFLFTSKRSDDFLFTKQQLFSVCAAPLTTPCRAKFRLQIFKRLLQGDICTQMRISPTDLDFSVSFGIFCVHIYRSFIPFCRSLSPSRRQFLNSRQNNGDATSTVTPNLWKIKASRVQFIGENTVVVAS